MQEGEPGVSTQVTRVGDRRGVDGDRLDGGWRPWRPVAAVLLAGVVLGGAVGALYGGSRPASYQAQTSLSVLPDSAVTSQVPGTPVGAPAQDATSFIQSQLVVLNGEPLRRQVQQTLRLPSSPQLSSTQVAQTYVVQVAATAPKRATAIAATMAASEAYTALRRKQLGADVDAAVGSVRQQVATVRDSLARAQLGDVNTATPGPESTALRDEYERLLAVSSSLELSRGQVGRAVTTITPANVTSAGSLSRVAKDGVAGALLGVLLGLGALTLARRALPRIRSVADVTALGLPVLLPVLPRRSPLSMRRSPAGRSRQGRLLASRLAGGDPSALAPIVVFGATRSVGASYVARTLAAHLVERAQVLIVLADGDVPPVPVGNWDVDSALGRAVASPTPGVSTLAVAGEHGEAALRLRALLASGLLPAAAARGWIVVVDAPPLSESDLGLDFARAAGGAALVAGRSVSRPADLLGAAELFDTQGQQLIGVVINDVPRLQRLRRKLTPQPEPVADAEAANQQPERTPSPEHAPQPEHAHQPEHAPQPENAHQPEHAPQSENARQPEHSSPPEADHRSAPEPDHRPAQEDASVLASPPGDARP